MTDQVLEGAVAVTQIYNALKHSRDGAARLETFYLLAEGRNISETADEVDCAYSTVHKYANDLEQAGLLTVADGEYQQTELGETVWEMTEELAGKAREQILSSVTEQRDNLAEQLRDLGYGQDDIDDILTGSEE